MLQEVGATADGANREPTPDQFCHHGQIGIDPGRRLGSADTQAQRDDLVEHEHRAGGAAGRGDVAKKLRRRGDHACRAAYGLEHDGRQIRGVTLDLVQKAFAVAVRRLQGLGTRVELVVGAVVALGRLQEQAPAGRAAGDSDGEHPRLGARVAESDPVDRRNPPAQRRGQIDLLRRGCGPGRAALEGGGNRVHHRRVAVAVDEARVVQEQIDQPVSVGVPQERPVGPVDREREGRVVGGGARVAAGHHVGRAPHQRLGTRKPCLVGGHPALSRR